MATPGQLDRLQDRIEQLEQRAERERKRREEAEQIAEASTRELYERQSELEQLAAELEHRVQHRTAELRQRLDQQTALQEISRFALRRLEIEDLVEELCLRTAEVLDTDHCEVFELAPSRQELVLRYGVGWPESFFDQARVTAHEGTQPGHTIQNWEPTIVHDQRREERFAPPALFEEQGILSGVTVVVPAPENPWGIFGVHAREPRAFDEDDVAFVQTMSRVLSQAIQRQRAQIELEEEKTRFESLVQQVEEYAIFSCDAQGHVETWNSGARRIKGYREEEIIGEHMRVFYTEEDREAGIPERNLRQAAEEGSHEDEGWRVRKDGSRFWANVSMTALRDEAGQLRGYAKVTRDMTDRMQYERRLEESNRRLDQFAYAASHDLKEPLRMVSSYLELVQDRYADELDAEAIDYLDQAAGGTERMRSMIDSLLAFARVRTEGNPLEPVDAEQVLEDVLSDLQVQIEETGAVITAEELPTVEADPDQLGQVFRNLISNALHYHGEEAPQIHVWATPVEDGWRFSVEDEGVGIPPEAAERIFDVFESLSERGAESGTGIGLAVCQQVVDRHGGEIWVESEPGEGSIFHFTMPEADKARA